MRTQWNERENDALLELPWRARVVYLQGLRWHMDYQTGNVGMSGYTMSYQKLSEVLDCTDAISTKPDPRVSKEGLRAIFRMLERVGLVEWVKHEGKGLIFRCLLADTQQSAQNKDNPKTTPRQPQTDNPKKRSNGAAYSVTSNPKTTPCCTREDNPPLGSGYQEEESSPLPPPCERTWTPPPWLNRAAWAEFEQHRREMHKTLTDLARTKAANLLRDLDHAQQQACIDRSIQSRWAGLFPDKVNAHEASQHPSHHSHESAHERRRRINLELIEGAKQHFR